MKKSPREKDGPINLSGRGTMMSESFTISKRKTHLSIIRCVKKRKTPGHANIEYQHNTGLGKG